MSAVAGAILGAGHSPTRQRSPPAAFLGAGKAKEAFFSAVSVQQRQLPFTNVNPEAD